LSEAMRMVCEGIIVGAPFETPEVVAQETHLTAYFRNLNSQDHPWLQEHRLRGLPNLEAITRQIQSFGWPWKVWGHGNVYLWAKLLRADFYAGADPNLLPLRSEIDQLYNREFFAKDWVAPVYRHFIIAV